jgi:hypothetical protein
MRLRSADSVRPYGAGPDHERLIAKGLLMNMVLERRTVMQYRDHEFNYESESDEAGTRSSREQSAGKQYRSKRSAKPRRRRSTKASSPGLGISGRRNHRWSW